MLKKICILFLSLWSIAYCKEKLPYSLSFEFSDNQPESYEEIGLDFLFYNNSKKEILNFTIVVILDDFQWSQTEGDSSNLKLKVEETVNPENYYDFFKKIKIASNGIENNSSIIEYFYISYIQYSDGSVWTDPFGIKKY